MAFSRPKPPHHCTVEPFHHGRVTSHGDHPHRPRPAAHCCPCRRRAAHRPLLTVAEATEGFNSEIASRVTSATGTWHIKGLRTDHPRAWAQRREAAIAPFTGVAPALRWRVETAGWDLLGFDALEGHHADFTPGSPDLQEVAALLCRLAGTPARTSSCGTPNNAWSATQPTPTTSASSPETASCTPT